MKINLNGKIYETKYFPFFRSESHQHFTIYTIRYPSGFVEEMLVFDDKNYMLELREHLVFLLKEYGLEEDDMLTPFAQRLKKDVRDLFGIE
jgi:hypothetical protein